MTNLITAAALACTLAGALILFVSHCSVQRAACRIIAGYPRVLDRLRAHRHDARLGMALIACGAALQTLAAFGYSAPLHAWRLPTFAGLAAILPYCVWRLTAARWIARPRATQGPREIGMRVFETRRSFRLRQAAMAQASALDALEQRYRALSQPARLAA